MDACRVQTANLSDVAEVRHSGAKTVDREGHDRADSPSTVGAGLTVRAWGATWLSRREREGVRSIADDRSRWRVHFETEHGDDLLTSWTPARAREWLSLMSDKVSSNPLHKNKKPIAGGTIKNTLNLLRRSFQDAIDDGLLEGPNPFAHLRIRRSRNARTREAWTVLTLDEQQRTILALGDMVERLIVQFAIGSGLRQSEQWSLRLADTHLDDAAPYVLVRFGRVLMKKPRGATMAERIGHAWFVPTKSGKPRRVPLFGIALSALRQWMSILKRYAPRNPHGLVFPRADGLPRMKGRAFRAFSRVSTLVGRSVRWHDLRHTCGSSLVGGWWGPPWSLEEVRVFLGHATIAQTERYAHFAPDRLNSIAARTLEGEKRHDETGSGGAGAASADPSGAREVSSGVRSAPRPDARGAANGAVARSVEARTNEGVTTMVDDRECEELENASDSAPESADEGRFSSVVEQRFRNPEAVSASVEPEAETSDEPPRPNGARALIAVASERDVFKLEAERLRIVVASREARISSLDEERSLRLAETSALRKVVANQNAVIARLESELEHAASVVAARNEETDRLAREAEEWRSAYARSCASAVGRLSSITPSSRAAPRVIGSFITSEGDAALIFATEADRDEARRLLVNASPSSSGSAPFDGKGSTRGDASPRVESSLEGIDVPDFMFTVAQYERAPRAHDGEWLRRVLQVAYRSGAATATKRNGSLYDDERERRCARFSTVEQHDAAILVLGRAREFSAEQKEKTIARLATAAIDYARACNRAGLRAARTDANGLRRDARIVPENGHGAADGFGGEDFPAVDERAPDMATAAAAVAERDARTFGERETSPGLADDLPEGPYRAAGEAERAARYSLDRIATIRRAESPRIDPARLASGAAFAQGASAPAEALEVRHRKAVGLLSDAVKALHAAESFLNEEVRK